MWLVVPSGIQDLVRMQMKAQVLLPGTKGLVVELSSAGGLECTYDGCLQSFSPGPSLDVISGKKWNTKTQ